MKTHLGDPGLDDVSRAAGHLLKLVHARDDDLVVAGVLVRLVKRRRHDERARLLERQLGDRSHLRGNGIDAVFLKSCNRTHLFFDVVHLRGERERERE